MPSNESAGARILAAHARHYANTKAEWEAARNAGALADELTMLEAQAEAARRKYQELSVDLSETAPRPWWRFW